MEQYTSDTQITANSPEGHTFFNYYLPDSNYYLPNFNFIVTYYLLLLIDFNRFVTFRWYNYKYNIIMHKIFIKKFNHSALEYIISNIWNLNMFLDIQ